VADLSPLLSRFGDIRRPLGPQQPPPQALGEIQKAACSVKGAAAATGNARFPYPGRSEQQTKWNGTDRALSSKISIPTRCGMMDHIELASLHAANYLVIGSPQNRSTVSSTTDHICAEPRKRHGTPLRWNRTNTPSYDSGRKTFDESGFYVS
jgi:hypothetical protein